MKSAILGLRKRVTYNELINDLSNDPDIKYPDRTASQMENSMYLSQLRGGFEQMILQSDNIMKQKQKELLLQEEAGSVPHSHHEHVIRENSWRHHVPPDPTVGPDEPMPESIPLRVPVGMPQEYAPDDVAPIRSRKRIARTIRDVGSPENIFGRGAIAHDVTNEANSYNTMIIEEEEMKIVRDEEIRQLNIQTSQLMLQEAQNHEIEDIMTGRGDKRREEGANPKPSQPKARTAGWEKDDSIPKAPPPKANSTSASSSTDTPYAKAKAKAKPEPEPENQESTRSKTKPVKKDVKQKPAHDTELVTLSNFEEWNAKGKGFLVDQIQKRPGIKFTKTNAKKMNKKEMIDKLLRFDGKL
jgi:hypothetical protein